MNTLVVSPDIDSGGVACVVRNLVQHLRTKGHNVQIFHSGRSFRARLRPSGLGFQAIDLRLQMPIGNRPAAVSVPVFLILFPVAFFQLLWLIRKHHIAAVNIHYPSAELCYFALCRKFLRFTLVCSIHGADLFPDGEPRQKYPWGIRMLLRHSDRIVAPSADLRRKLLESFPEHAGKAVFIHNGIEVEKFSRAPAEGCGRRSRYILSVSAYKKQKNLDVLIRAMRIVADHDRTLKLVLVGEGTSLRHELELLAASLGLREQVEFHGKKTPAEIAALLHECEVFVLPSRFETFGIAVVEAMACRRPVVVTNAGGMPEIVRHGRSGFVVETGDARALADALITLCNDSALRRQFGEAGFEDAQQSFHSSIMGKRYVETFALADMPAIANAKMSASESAVPGVRVS